MYKFININQMFSKLLKKNIAGINHAFCIFLMMMQIIPINSDASRCPDGKSRNCEQLCIKSPTDPNTYECACTPGFQIKNITDIEGKTKCEPVYAKSQFLIAKSQGTHNIFYLNLSRQENEKPVIIVYTSNGHTIQDITYDHLHNHLYWFNGFDKELKGGSFQPDSKSLESNKLIRHLNDLTAVVPNVQFDSGSQTLYYLNQFQGVVGAIKMSELHHKILIHRNDAHIDSMAISPKLGIIVWTEIDFTYSIQMYSAFLNGTGIKRLLTEGYNENAQLAIDDESKRVLWMRNRMLCSFQLDRLEKEILKNDSTFNNVKALAVDDNKVYLSEVEGISIAPKTMDFEKQYIKTTLNMDKFSVLHLGYNSSEVDQPGEKEKALADYLIPKTKCYSADNGGCQQFCFPGTTPNDRSCGCADGYTIDPSDGTSCVTKKPWKSFIAVTDGQLQKIFIINLAHPNYFRTLPINSSERPVAMRFDPLSRNLIWSDIGHDNFQYFSSQRFVHFEGTEEPKVEKDGTFVAMDKKPPKVLRKQKNPESLTDGMALEPIRRLLYYSDTGKKSIGVYDLESRMNKDIITQNLIKPRSIALERVSGLMFWTDWGAAAKIERATMAGTERKMILTGADYLVFPNGLVSDGTKLYWIDAKLDHLGSCSFDGTDITLFKMKSTHPFGLSLTANHFYWSDWLSNTVRRKSRHDKNAPIEDLTPPTFSRLLDITTFESDEWDKQFEAIVTHSKNNVDPNNDPMADGCYYKGQLPKGVNYSIFGNGGCSQFCFPLPQKERVCDCREDDILDKDGITCLDTDGKPSDANFARRNPEIYLTHRVDKPNFEWDFVDHTPYANSLLCSEHDMEIEANTFKLNCITDSAVLSAETTQPSSISPSSQKMQCNYQCLPGFRKISGDEIRTCYVSTDLKEVKWSGSNLVCEAITCNKLEPPKNSELVSCNTTYGTQCQFACQGSSQYISGDQTRTCQMDGTWSGTSLLCQSHECQYPSINPEHHIKVISCPANPKLGEECRFECLPNYERVSGSIVIKCDPKGLWSADVLHCKETNNQCPLPDTNHYNISLTKCDIPTKFGDTCYFECSPSNNYVIYKPVDDTSSTAVCQHDGTWSKNILQCTASRLCSIPQLPIFTQNISCSAHSPNSQCGLKCTEGKHKIAGAENVTCLENGEWNQNIIVCSDCPPLKPLPSIDNLNLSCTVDNLKSSEKSDSFVSNCHISCRPTGWMNVINQRSSKVSLMCDEDNKRNNPQNPWTITSPSANINQTNYLNIIPYCGELVSPNSLKMKLWITIEKEQNPSSKDLLCSNLIPEIITWLTVKVLTFNTTKYGQACLSYMGYNNHQSSSLAKNMCPLSDFNLTCDSSIKDKKLFKTTGTNQELLPLKLHVLSNPRFSGGHREGSDFWYSIFKVMKNTINESQIITHLFSLDRTGSPIDKFFIIEPSPSTKKIDSITMECSSGMASIENDGICVKCPQGTKFEQGINKCVLCQQGYYQNKEGQTKCIRCPRKLTTLQDGSHQAIQCVRSSKKRIGAVAAMFIIFMVVCLVVLIGLGIYLFKKKQYPFNLSSKLIPIPTIFRSHNPEPQELTSVPYGSFDNPLAVA